MKSLFLSLVVTLSFNANAFYCADGSAEFRVEFTEPNGNVPALESFYDGMKLTGDTQYGSDMDFKPKVFEAKVRDSGDSFVLYYAKDKNVLSIEVSKEKSGYMVVGGIWNDPNSGVKTPVYPVKNASYKTTKGQIVSLEDLYEGKMSCWWSGAGPTLETAPQ